MRPRAPRQIENLTGILMITLVLIATTMFSGIASAQAYLQNNRYANPSLEKRKIVSTDGLFRSVTAENLLRLPISIRLPFGSKEKLITPIVSFGNKGSRQTVTAFESFKSFSKCKSFTRKWGARMLKIVQYKDKVTLHGFCIEVGSSRKTSVAKSTFDYGHSHQKPKATRRPATPWVPKIDTFN